MIPKINYPEEIDSNNNLYEVDDGLRLVLSEDYYPGDKSISFTGKAGIIDSFDETGIITLTEQCSDPKLRAISFYYGSRTNESFNDLEILPGFIDVVKPKNITNITQNVVSAHHNNIKDALINIEHFVGIEGETGSIPLKGTMEQRINYLRKIALVPKPWFKADKTVGLAPLKVNFTDQSFMLATDTISRSVTHVWDFGDNTSSNTTQIIVSDGVVPDQDNITASVNCPKNSICSVEKTYSKPGIYDVSLTITNDIGTHKSTETVIFPELINVRYPAPKEALVEIDYKGGLYIKVPGTKNSNPLISPIGSGPYLITPKIRAPINSIIDIYIEEETNRDIPGSYTDKEGINRSNSGEEISTNEKTNLSSPIDPIDNYTWFFSDDLSHSNSKNTKALFGIGGYYDMILRTDTTYGSYRITSYKDAFDIVEKTNLWLWNYSGENEDELFSYEYGLLSQTFKIKNSPSSFVHSTDESFLTPSKNNLAIKEFKRNNGAIQRGSSYSGEGGTSLLYWASGRGDGESPLNEKININEFNGYQEVYVSKQSINREWNWLSFGNSLELYFILGNELTRSSVQTNQNKISYDLNLGTYKSSFLTNQNYKNGADDLKENNNIYNIKHDDSSEGAASFSTYRSEWHNDAGYFLKSSGGSNFYRINSFYKTGGTVTETFLDIKKLTDLPQTKVEGQLVSLENGLYFFNNSGSVSAYGPTTGIWSTGGPGAASLAFRSLQDIAKEGFDDLSNTLLAASDKDKLAFLSYDYSEKSFIKFSETDLTFSSLNFRPQGLQWQMYIF